MSKSNIIVGNIGGENWVGTNNGGIGKMLFKLNDSEELKINHDRLVEENKRIDKLEDKITVLLQCLYEIQSECIGEIAMGYKLDAQSIGESITHVTGLNNPELLQLLEASK
jgi:hypothetical protein